jgi:hypothetical protein
MKKTRPTQIATPKTPLPPTLQQYQEETFVLYPRLRKLPPLPISGGLIAEGSQNYEMLPLLISPDTPIRYAFQM